MVGEIVEDVRTKGDRGLFFWEKKFSGRSRKIIFTKNDFKRAFEKISPSVRKAMLKIERNISSFQKKVLSCAKPVKFKRGDLEISFSFVPFESVGIYIPGGKFPYPSSVFMNALPARCAGVGEIYAVSARVTDEILAACFLSGVKKLFKISGAQAIAALAFGTKTIPAVDFIAGPGGKYVVEAKKLVFGSVGIDTLAGPTEIAILADEYADEKIVFAEVDAQLEHDSLSLASVVSSCEKLIEAIKKKYGKKVKAILEKNRARQLKIIEEIAPEHLFVFVKDLRFWEGKFKKAGAVFLGKFSSVVMGDYVAGPSHTLPTGGCARFSSGISALTFLRTFAQIKYGKKTFLSDAGAAAEMAKAEGMTKHLEAVKLRIEDFDKGSLPLWDKKQEEL